MDESSVYVVAMGETLPDTQSEVRSILARLAETSRGERGCISYQLFYDSAAPMKLNTIEVWRDAAAFEAHMQAAHTVEALGGLAGKLAATPEIRVLTRIA